ncbi:alpha/beta fold hydrolase [Actinoalloteichus spitiensis]|uniref:alpha/beta fold hydrolase n=1 Tax=Actinoalloteichus spitiensis TaxID=252394 RepID=UPI0003711F16|nr:alpha/beta hydrolase [Actinoalloteichus spitiensis]
MAVLPHDVLGDGPHHVLALHGWLSDRSAFEPITRQLDTDRFTWAFVDYRGYGEAMRVAGEHTTAETASDVLAVADSLGWPNFSLVGHSMGGKVAASVLAESPERVRKIVGVSPVPASGVPFDEQAWELFSGAAESAANRRAIIDMTTGGRLSGRWLDAMVRRSLDRSTVAAFAGYLRDWARTDFQQKISGDTTPMLLIAGEHDPALSAEMLRDTWTRHHPNAQVELFRNAGHYAIEEAPLITVTRIEEFLAS